MIGRRIRLPLVRGRQWLRRGESGVAIGVCEYTQGFRQNAVQFRIAELAGKIERYDAMQRRPQHLTNELWVAIEGSLICQEKGMLDQGGSRAKLLQLQFRQRIVPHAGKVENQSVIY